VTTIARSLVVLEKRKEPVPFWPPTWSLTAFVLLFFCSLLVLQVRSRKPCLRRVLVAWSLIVIIAINTAGCGGAGGSGTASGIGGTVVPPPTPQTGTTAGTYTVTVIANSTSLTRTMTLTLVVQ
jgi:hypothetical protein